MNINEIVRTLNQVADEVSKSQREMECTKDSVKQNNKLFRIARKHPIVSHILSESAENIQYNYIAGLIYLTDLNNSECIKTQQRLLIYRLAASVQREIAIEDCIARSMKIDFEFWDDFLSALDSKTMNCFVVDVLLLSVLDANSVKQKKYEEISDILQLLHKDKDEIEILARIARAIAEQNFEQFTELIQPGGKIEYSYFLGYFEHTAYTAVATSIEDVQNIEGDILIVNAVISHDDTIIDLSNWVANSICFMKCSFEFIRGIKSIGKKIKFYACCFKGNLFHATKKQSAFRFVVSGYAHSYWEVEENYTFIEGENLEFLKSKFMDCTVSKCLLNISNSSINGCEFLNCEGKNLPCSYMFTLANTAVEDSSFVDCKMETSSEDRGNTFGGIVILENGNMRECNFERCDASGTSSYGSFAHYAMQIVCAVNSKIIGCHFDHCDCSSYTSSDKTVTSYILGLKNAKEKNNTFVECSSYHYQYSEIGLSHNMGNI